MMDGKDRHHRLHNHQHHHHHHDNEPHHDHDHHHHHHHDHGKPSPSKWRFAIALSRFFIVFLDVGFSKSLGVLIRDMVERYGTDYKTMAFVCSIPPTFMYLLAPFVHMLMKRVSGRVLSLTGGIISSSCLIASPYAPDILPLAACFLGVGFGMSLTIFPIVVVMNEYFGRDFIFWATLTNFGVTAGAFVLPLVTERSFETYGYNGAFLLLGGIALNTLVCGTTIRRPKDWGSNTSPKNGHRRLRHDEAEMEAGEVEKEEVFNSDSGQQSADISDDESSQCSSSEDDSMEVAMEALIHIRRRSDSYSSGNSTLNNNGINDSANGHCESLLMEELPHVSFNNISEEQTQELDNCLHTNSTKNTADSITQLSFSPDARGILPRILSRLKSNVIFREQYFALMFPGIFLNGYAQYAWCLFIVPHAEWLGIEPSKAVFLATMAGMSGVFGRITFLLADRLKVDVILYFAVMSAFSSLVYFIDPLSASFWFLSLTTVLQAIAVFGMDSFPTVIAKSTIRDKRSFSSAMSVSYIVNSLGLIAGNVLTGHIFDITSSPTIVFLHLGGVNALISVNCFLHVIISRCFKPETQIYGGK